MAAEVKPGISKPALNENQLSQIAYFNKIADRLTKTVERPYNKKYGYVSRSVFNKDYSIEDIHNAARDLSAPLMRDISIYYYNSSASYQRIIDFFSTLYMYYYTYDIVGLENANPDSARKLYNESLSFLDGFNVEETFQNIATSIMVEGAFFGYLTFSENGKTLITRLDPNYCQTRYISSFGTKIVEFNVQYFDRYTDEDELKEVLKSFPKEVRKAKKMYDNGVISSPWAVLPAEESCAFTFSNGNIYPPLFDTIIDIINFDDYKDIEKKRDSQELEKILIQKFKMDANGDLKVLLEEMAKIHEAASEIFREHDNIDVLTTIADSVELADTQTSTTTARNNIEKMLLPKYENAGLSYELFSSTSSSSLESSVTNSTAFMSQIINSFSTWLSMIVYSRFNFKKMSPVVTILPITWFNQKKMREDYLKNAQYGYSVIAPYVASGKRQSTILSNKFLENDILKLHDVLVPLESSHTQASEEVSNEDAGAANVKEPEDRADGTVENIETK